MPKSTKPKAAQPQTAPADHALTQVALEQSQTADDQVQPKGVTAARPEAACPDAQALIEDVQSPEPAPSSKLGKLIALLQRADGATLAELMEATGWQAHSVRGALAGAIKKKLGLPVVSDKPGNERIYRVAAV